MLGNAGTSRSDNGECATQVADCIEELQSRLWTLDLTDGDESDAPMLDLFCERIVVADDRVSENSLPGPSDTLHYSNKAVSIGGLNDIDTRSAVATSTYEQYRRHARPALLGRLMMRLSRSSATGTGARGQFW